MAVTLTLTPVAPEELDLFESVRAACSEMDLAHACDVAWVSFTLAIDGAVLIVCSQIGVFGAAYGLETMLARLPLEGRATWVGGEDASWEVAFVLDADRVRITAEGNRWPPATATCSLDDINDAAEHFQIDVARVIRSDVPELASQPDVAAWLLSREQERV